MLHELPNHVQERAYIAKLIDNKDNEYQCQTGETKPPQENLTQEEFAKNQIPSSIQGIKSTLYLCFNQTIEL